MSNETRRLVLREKYVSTRGLGLPAGTVLLLEKTSAGVTVVDYTTPHGAYGNFVVSSDDEVKKIARVAITEPTKRRRPRGRNRSRRR